MNFSVRVRTREKLESSHDTLNFLDWFFGGYGKPFNAENNDLHSIVYF
jgi:hypothetical protein